MICNIYHTYVSYTLPLKWRSTLNPTHTLSEVAFFLGFKRSILSSHSCKPEAQKTFQISQTTPGLNKENKMKQEWSNKGHI